jgi:hypothetical protein
MGMVRQYKLFTLLRLLPSITVRLCKNRQVVLPNGIVRRTSKPSGNITSLLRDLYKLRSTSIRGSMSRVVVIYNCLHSCALQNDSASLTVTTLYSRLTRLRSSLTSVYIHFYIYSEAVQQSGAGMTSLLHMALLFILRSILFCWC